MPSVDYKENELPEGQLPPEDAKPLSLAIAGVEEPKDDAPAEPEAEVKETPNKVFKTRRYSWLKLTPRGKK